MSSGARLTAVSYFSASRIEYLESVVPIIRAALGLKFCFSRLFGLSLRTAQGTVDSLNCPYDRWWLAFGIDRL